MNRDVNLFQVLIRFQEPDNCRTDFVARLSDFTNYDGLVAANNPINAINVDIRSYGFDHVMVRGDIYSFIKNIGSHNYLSFIHVVRDRFDLIPGRSIRSKQSSENSSADLAAVE